MGGKRWTHEEIEYLKENWGTKSVPALAEKLGRSQSSILVRKDRLNLGTFLDNHPNGAVSLSALFRILGKRYSSYTMISWVEQRGLPVFHKKVRNCNFRMVDLDKFWKWAEKNQDFLDFSKLEPYALGAEPEWVGVKRGRDKIKGAFISNKPWTKNEDERLIKYLEDNRYTLDEISGQLCRTNGAVVRRISTLGLKQKPVKAYTHNNYTDSEIVTIKAMVSCGCNYYELSDKTGRSEKALRGLIYRWYKTERLDKARELMKAEGREIA